MDSRTLRQAAAAALPRGAFLRRDRGEALFVTDAPRQRPEADWPGIAARLARSGFAGPLTFELNRSSKPGRHENDAYGATPLREYLAEALARARRVAALVAAGGGAEA